MRQRLNYKVVLQCIIYAIISCALSALVHALNSAFIEGVHGKPSFVSTKIYVYSFYTNMSFAMVYVLIGHLIPIKNNMLRGFVYIALIWGSNFMPQIMGLACADGAIAKEAFSMSIVICDSIGYLFDGLMLGLIVRTPSDNKKKNCSAKSMVKTSLISMIAFPVIIIIINTILETINKDLGGRGAMGVSDQQTVPFYICFYGCFLVTGLLLPLFYRMTVYNGEQGISALKFGLIYSIGIWTPVVLIMIIFGTALLPTVIYTFAFIVALVVIAYINQFILYKFEQERVIV